MFRPRLRLPRAGSRIQQPCQRRLLHRVPPLPHDFSKNGVPGLLSKEGFDIAWTQYMDLMLERVNDLTAGTDLDELEIKSIVTTTARDPARAALFNHASMAHNNHFFFRSLLNSPSSSATTSSSASSDAPPPSMSPQLHRALVNSFSSLTTLRRELVATAMGMFGPGFVWIVRRGGVDSAGGAGTTNAMSPLLSSGFGGASVGGSSSGGPAAAGGDFRILVTYLAGSPYPAAHWRRQEVDMNTAPGYGSGVGGQQHHHLQQQPATAGAPGTSIPPSTSRPGYLGPWPGTAWTSTGRVLGHTSSATAGPGSTGIQHSPVSPNLHAPMAAGGALGVPAWKRTPPGGVPDLLPVLCLNTWEHVWLHDYGIRGKREYVENWWKVIDWEVVAGVAGIGGEVSGGRW